MSDNPIVLSVSQAARLLGISRNAAYEGVRRGEIPHVRVGRRILIGRHRLLEWAGARDEGRNDVP